MVLILQKHCILREVRTESLYRYSTHANLSLKIVPWCRRLDTDPSDRRHGWIPDEFMWGLWRQSSIWTGLSPNTAVFLRHCHSTNAPWSSSS